MALEMSHFKKIGTMVNCLDSGLLVGRTMTKWRSIVITVSVRTEAPMERYAKNGNSLQRNTCSKSSWKPLDTYKQVRHKRAAWHWWRQEYLTPCIAYHYQGSQNGFIKRALHTPFLLSPSPFLLIYLLAGFRPLFLLFLSPSSFNFQVVG